jgi:hypothetical protein
VTFRHRQPALDARIRQAGDQQFERPGEFGDDNELSSPSFDGLNQFVIEEAHIGPNPDLTHLREHLGEAGIRVQHF